MFHSAMTEKLLKVYNNKKSLYKYIYKDNFENINYYDKI